MQRVHSRLLASLVIATSLLFTACSKPPSQQALNHLETPEHNSILGNPAAPITLVEFLDYNCPDCKKTAAIIDQFVQTHPNVRVIFKEYPLFGPSSVPATSAALAAHNQGKYLQMHHALLAAHAHRLKVFDIAEIARTLNLDQQRLMQDMHSTAVMNQVKANALLAQKLGVKGAPSLFALRSNQATLADKQQPQLASFVGNPTAEDLAQLIKRVTQE